MVVHVERTTSSYRLTMHALVARAVLVGALAAVALSGECAPGWRWIHTSVTGRRATSAGPVRNRLVPATDSR